MSEKPIKGPLLSEGVLTQDADWRLIAAAPDLLEACRLAEQHFARNQASGEWQGDDEHQAWTGLLKAIAKAEGR